MTTYYLNNSSGSDSNSGTATGSPWKTFSKAMNSISSGDTVLLQTSTWNAQLRITVPNTVWKAQTSHSPVIDGLYHRGLMRDNGTLPPPAGYIGAGQGLVVLAADNIRIEGLRLKNSAEAAVSGSNAGFHVKDCLIDWTYGAGVSFNGGAERRTGVIVEGNRISESSVRFYDPTRSGAGPESLAQSIKVGDALNGIIRDNECVYGYGEGIDIGKNDRGMLVYGNTVGNHRHKHIYVVWSQDVHIFNNIVYWTEDDWETGKGFAAGGISIKDESAGDGKGVLSNGIYIYNNLTVGMQGGIGVGGAKAKTRVDRLYIGYNTVVGGRRSETGLTITTDVQGQHKGIVENNIFDMTHAPASASGAVGNFASGIAFRNNVFSKAVDSKWRGTGTRIGDPKLVNPGAVILSWEATGPGTPAALHNLNTRNYDLSAESALCVNYADTSRTPANGTTPPLITTDFYGATRDDADVGYHEYDGVIIIEDEVFSSFQVFPASGPVPLTVTFTSTSEVQGAAVIDEWSWDFGDGGTSNLENPTHEYTTAGSYTPTLTVRDTSLSLTHTSSGSPIVVGSTDGVTANFTRTPASGSSPLLVTFTNTSTVRGTAVINEYRWTFGDGATSALENPTHEYTTAGTYTPTLRVRDTVLGLSHTVTKLPITVLSGDSIAASFTHTPASGTAPLSVAFTNTTAVSGVAVDDRWSWLFGDGGTSDLENPTHVYGSPGVYTPTLTATDSTRNLSSSYMGQPIQVRAETGAQTVIFNQSRTALATVDGEQTFTASLGGLTAKSARFILTKATADGSAADGELLGIGFATGSSNQVAASIATAHGAADSNGSRLFVSGACILLIDPDGVEVLRGTFVSFGADSVVVNLQWAGAGTAYLCTVVLGGGAEYRAWAGPVAIGAGGSVTDLTAPAFAPDAITVAATWGTDGSPGTDATISLGLAHRSGPQFVLERKYTDAKGTAENYLRFFNDQVAHSRYNPSSRASVEVFDWDASGLSFRAHNDSINSTILVLAELYGSARSDVSSVTSNTTAAAKDYVLGWQPQFVTHLLGNQTVIGSLNNIANAGTIGLHTAVAASEFSNLVSGETGATTTNEQSVSDNKFLVVGHTGTETSGGATTMDTLKYVITFTTAPATAQQWPRLAVEVGSASAPIEVIAEFTASVREGLSPLTVAFTDLSSGTTDVTRWSWNFGDGSTSTDENPTHVYQGAGSYNVSLTAGNDDAEDEELKLGYIVVTSVPKRRIIVGPYLMNPVTASSPQATYYDPEGVTPGRMSTSLQLTELPLADDPEVPDAASGVVKLYADSASGDLKLIRGSGVIGTIDVT